MTELPSSYRCLENVTDGRYSTRCKNRNGHGPFKLYCKDHAKFILIKTKRENKQNKYK